MEKALAKSRGTGIGKAQVGRTEGDTRRGTGIDTVFAPRVDAMNPEGALWGKREKKHKEKEKWVKKCLSNNKNKRREKGSNEYSFKGSGKYVK